MGSPLKIIDASPFSGLTLCFVLWKLLLLLVAILSPGPGYDVSTHQILGLEKGDASFISQPLTHVAWKLTRWDAIYFVTLAHRDYVWEQEWAFSWGWTRLIKLVTRLSMIYDENSMVGEALVGIGLAHVFHYASVLVLYRLAWRLTPGASEIKRRLAFVAALLHIICPAGLFLSAPYGEALTSFFSFLGILFYLQENELSTLVAGICFGLGCLARSNLILNGAFFLWDVFGQLLPELYGLTIGRDRQTQVDRRLVLNALRRLTASVSAGLILAGGFILPQAVAYRAWCVPFDPTTRREWCDAFPPSIYSYVQAKYWDNGFLKYWKISNIPLFLFAAPMIAIMIWSALQALLLPSQAQKKQRDSAEKKSVKSSNPETNVREQYDHEIVSRLRRVALPQFMLAILAITNLHIQIITRLATAYPLIYIWVASNIVQTQNSSSLVLRSARGVRASETVVRYMVIYAIVQGGLFASFLPPA